MDLMVRDAVSKVRKDANDWLTHWLPNDYHERFLEYRLDLTFRSRYQAAAFDAGWLNPAWPSNLGGRDLDQESAFWVKLDFTRAGAPKLPNVQGPGVIAYALREFGTAAQQKYIHDVARGDAWWCLGMSEPSAGSDLASMRSHARAVEGGFVVNGQKVWTSHARQASHCLLFAKTDSKIQPPHRGISAFIMPMSTPGITVRKIDKIGPEDEEFCEVFLDDVTLPEDALLGEVGLGWSIAMASLGHERDMIWMMNLVEAEHALGIARMRLDEDGTARRLGIDYARLRARADAIWLTGVRGLAHRLVDVEDEQTPLLKLASTELAQEAFHLAARAAGPSSVEVGNERWEGGEIAAGEIEALGATLYGGTSEIQRNIIGERILKLPRS